MVNELCKWSVTTDEKFWCELGIKNMNLFMW